mgnify:FL=1|tara:strand:- start:4213 stop:4416 length:204 start_codon:yes stop_codon:yes gene_type:complete
MFVIPPKYSAELVLLPKQAPPPGCGTSVVKVDVSFNTRAELLEIVTSVEEKEPEWAVLVPWIPDWVE